MNLCENLEEILARLVIHPKFHLSSQTYKAFNCYCPAGRCGLSHCSSQVVALEYSTDLHCNGKCQRLAVCVIQYMARFF